MLLPTELETAMSPNPFRATMTEVMRSGIDVPAAKKVRPITSGGILAVSPTTLAHHTIKYEYAAIHIIEPKNVTGNNRLPAKTQKQLISGYSNNRVTRGLIHIVANIALTPVLDK